MQTPDARGKLLDEPAVVAHEEQRLAVVHERVLHPLAREKIEMVRRLVEHEKVDVVPHENAEPQTALLAAGEHRNGLEHILAPEAERRETVSRRLRIALRLPEHRVHHIARGIVKPHELRQVRALYRGAEMDPAAVRRFLTGDAAEQRGLARTVVADERNALARLYELVDAGEELLLAVGLRHVLEHKHLVAEKFLLPEADGELFVLARPFGGLEPRDALFHGERALVQLVRAHERPQMQIVCRLLQMGDLLLVFLVLPAQFLVPALLFLGIERIVAVIKLRLAVDDLNDPLRDLVEKPAVVRYGEYRPLEVEQIVLQPLGRVHVEMVRRLVEQENVGVLQNEAR